LQQNLEQANDENSALSSKLAENDITIDKLNKNASKYEAEKACLLSVINVLKADLSSTIYVKKMYVTPPPLL
jgi:hypothetical protein